MATYEQPEPELARALNVTVQGGLMASREVRRDDDWGEERVALTPDGVAKALSDYDDLLVGIGIIMTDHMRALLMAGYQARLLDLLDPFSLVPPLEWRNPDNEG